MDAITKNLRDIHVKSQKPAAANLTENFRSADSSRQADGLYPAVSFQDVLLSKHAAIRLNDRNINLSDDQMDRVADAIVKANEKGIRDSLVLVDNVALVVNVKSRTIVTAMNQDNKNVFSNIDGAVII